MYSIDGAKKYDTKGTQNAATNADKDEYLKVNAITNQIAKAIRATGQQVIKIKPNVEATPLPPLNFNHTGKLCPKTPKLPAISDALSE